MASQDRAAGYTGALHMKNLPFLLTIDVFYLFILNMPILMSLYEIYDYE